MKNKNLLLIIVTILIILIATYFIINNYYKSKMTIIETIEGLSKTDEIQINELISNDFFKDYSSKCNNQNTELSLRIGSLVNPVRDNLVKATVTCNCGFDEADLPDPNCISRRSYIDKIEDIWTIVHSGDLVNGG